MKQFNKLLLIVVMMCGVNYAIAQSKQAPKIGGQKRFYQLLKEVNLTFSFPSGFRSIPPIDNEDFSYDFAMEQPGKDFEVWLQVKPQRQNWLSYNNARIDKTHKEVANPDSMYVDMSKAEAAALSIDSTILERNMPQEVLKRYNADAGKSYLINLTDNAITRHYKYALLVALQKNHTGTLIMVYLTNERDADFYREVYRTGHCLHFFDRPVK